MEKFVKAWRKSFENKSKDSSPSINTNTIENIENKQSNDVEQQEPAETAAKSSAFLIRTCYYEIASVASFLLFTVETSVPKSTSQTRHFLPRWTERFEWLSFNDTLQKVFCSVCTESFTVLNIKLPTGVTHQRCYDSFVKDGFSNWNKALDRFKRHEKTTMHRIAVTSVSRKQTNVSHMISKQLAQEKADARICLDKIFGTIRFLAVQGLPLRGNEEKNSSFIQLLRLRSEDQPLLKSWLERSAYRWLSHDIINEILTLMSIHVQRILLSEIHEQPFYAIMCDETTDASRKEQMSINVRYVDEELSVHETFLGFYDIPATDSETLFNVIIDALTRFDMKLNKCRGQCYDGASNMSGEITGLQTRIRELEARAYYTHCAGHNLSLVAQDAMKLISEIADFLSEMRELITFVRASAKRITIFKDIKIQLQDDETVEENVGSLKSFCPTRWTLRVISLKSVKNNYPVLLEFCEKVGLENSDAGIKARGLLKYLQKFETLILLEISIETLQKVEALNETLQATSINFASVIRRVNILKANLSKMRTDEKFHEIYERTTTLASRYDVDQPSLPRQRRLPKRLDENLNTHFFHLTPEEKYRVIYFKVIDQVLMSLDTRFDSETYKILGKMEEFALNKIEIDEIEQYLVSNLGKEDCDFDLQRLVLHRDMFFDSLKEGEVSKLDGLTKISIYLKEQKGIREFVSEYVKFIRLLLTSPQSVCVAERSFSSLKRLKTYMKANMLQQRTNDLSLLHVHRDIASSLDFDKILDEFIRRNDTRLKTFALSNEISN